MSIWNILIILGVILSKVEDCVSIIEPRLLGTNSLQPDNIPAGYQLDQHHTEGNENINNEQEPLHEHNPNTVHHAPSFQHEHPEVINPNPTVGLQAIAPATPPTLPTNNETQLEPNVGDHHSETPQLHTSFPDHLSLERTAGVAGSSTTPLSTIPTSHHNEQTSSTAIKPLLQSSETSVSFQSAGSLFPTLVYPRPHTTATCDLLCLLIRSGQLAASSTLGKINSSPVPNLLLVSVSQIFPTTTTEIVPLPTQSPGLILPEHRIPESVPTMARSSSTTPHVTASTSRIWMTLFPKNNTTVNRVTDLPTPQIVLPTVQALNRLTTITPEVLTLFPLITNSTSPATPMETTVRRDSDILVPITEERNTQGTTERAPTAAQPSSTSQTSFSSRPTTGTASTPTTASSTTRPTTSSTTSLPTTNNTIPETMRPITTSHASTTTPFPSTTSTNLISVQSEESTPTSATTIPTTTSLMPTTNSTNENTTQPSTIIGSTKRHDKHKIKQRTHLTFTPTAGASATTTNSVSSTNPVSSTNAVPTTTSYVTRKIHHNWSANNRTTTRRTTIHIGFMGTTTKGALSSSTSTQKPYTTEINLTSTISTTKKKLGSTTTLLSILTSTVNNGSNTTQSPTTFINQNITVHETVSGSTINNVSSASPASTVSTPPGEQHPVTTPSSPLLQSSVLPSASTTFKSLPPVFVTVRFRMSWSMFCVNYQTFQHEVVDILEANYKDSFNEEQVKIMNEEINYCVEPWSVAEEEYIYVRLYIVDYDGQYDSSLTVDCAQYFQTGFRDESFFKDKLVRVTLNTKDESRSNIIATADPNAESEDISGVTVAITIASVGGICCIAVIVLQFMMKRRYRKTRTLHHSHSHSNRRRFSVASNDSIALASVKSRPNSGLFNPALDLDIQKFINNNGVLSNPVNFAGLANLCSEPESIYEEFYAIKNEMPRLSTVPSGAEDKNRYANVIPIPRTRVSLKRKLSQATSDYINANFVTGYPDESKAYIATQAPLANTKADFWRMIWEQQSRVIVMLTAMDEHGHPKCAEYWPDCLGTLIKYAEFTVTLKKRDVTQEYIMSTIELKDIDNNLFREIKHIWYTCWPMQGLPEAISLVKFTIEIRKLYEDSGGPLVVHCSPGTGRTGTLLGIDICMRQYEQERVADVLNCVSKMRKERAGAVQTKEQYALMYQALNEYALYLNSPSISAASSVMTLHAVH
ncbi:mucin-2 [Patella vulgata]|uniref:mucin-2 n=1 Tax=Patella vulgata TaxID=6465 RepID=UPI002180261B|nr:mucin-2 [Patella vulgata]XP_050402790.1 mucin-2 [Patella vulgata]XP_050402792.1 mucin-2 [Patella vulgata]XP_050402793.1 mucin-2 [Patella vulgata]